MSISEDERERFSDEGEDVQDFKCEFCGSTKEPKVETFNEFDDADGNRGILVTYTTCKDCGEVI